MAAERRSRGHRTFKEEKAIADAETNWSFLLCPLIEFKNSVWIWRRQLGNISANTPQVVDWFVRCTSRGEVDLTFAQTSKINFVPHQ